MKKLRKRQSERLKTLKEEQGLTQRELGDTMCVTQQLVSKIIRGEASLKEEQANLLEKSYGYRSDWLLGFDPYKTKEDFLATTQQKTMESIVMDLARRAGYDVSAVSFTSQDDVTGRTLGRLCYLDVSDSNDDNKGRLRPEAIEWVGRKLVDYTNYLIWEALRLPDDEEMVVIENLGAWLRGESDGEE